MAMAENVGGNEGGHKDSNCLLDSCAVHVITL